MAVHRIVNQRLVLLNWIESRSSVNYLRRHHLRIRQIHDSTKLFDGLLQSHNGTIVVSHHQARFKSSSSHHHTASSTTLLTEGRTSKDDQDGIVQDNLDLSFCDAKAAFRSKTNFELLRAYIVFRLCGVDYLVDNNHKLMSLGQKVLGKKLFAKVMELTFYGHFVAGENQVAIQPKIQRLRSFGVKAILDYSVEEDISEEQAAKAEMESCNPKTLDNNDESDSAVKGQEKKEFDRFKCHEEFADRREGVESARTYFYMNEASCEKNMEIFIQSIEAVSGATKGTGFAAIKLTALGRPQLLLHLSEAIARVHRYVSRIVGHGFDQNIKPEDLQKRFERAAEKDPAVAKWLENMTSDNLGLIHVLPWQGVIGAQKRLRDVMQVADMQTGEMHSLLPPLTDEEEEMFRNMMRRLHTIFKIATKLDVRVMVDAEQTYFQPAISRITLEMMRVYNKEKAIVFNTYQCYLKDALRHLTQDLKQSERQNFYFGAKLVRGAYMEAERKRAKQLNYEDPINENYEATTAMYENCMEEGLKWITRMKAQNKTHQCSIMMATHNENSIRATIKKMKEYNILPSDRVVCFGQLYGMCDQVSFPLGQSGYSVYKYVPYGPVHGVLPYLSRRANENRGLLTKIEKEKRLLFTELKRRLLSGQFVYEPRGKYEPL